MLKFVLLLFAVAGFNARPLQYNPLQNGVWVIGLPQLVQDGQEYMAISGPDEHQRQDTKSEPQWEVVLAPEHTEMRDDVNQKVAPIEEHRQGTEPSRRFVVDLNTGLLKEYISEMDRGAEVYNPTFNSQFRQGTQNSQVTLVDTRTGQQLPQLSEMQRRAAPLSQFRQGTEYSEATLMELRKHQMMKRMEKAKVNKQETTHKAALPELRRQGTEPSRRFLVNPNTGLVKEHVSEMERRVSGFYNPASNSEFRQGTQNSQVTLVDIRTGQQLPQLSEMQRRAAPLSQFRQGTEYSEATLMELRKHQMMKRMDKAKVNKQETTHKAALPELRRQGTEPSRRFLVNPNTGLVKEHVSEMERRVSGFYNPASNSEFRQGTQNSQVTLVDIRTGQQLPQLSEMQRRAAPYSGFRQGTEYNLVTLMNLRDEQMMAKVAKDKILHTVQDMETNEVFPEFKRGIGYSQAQRQRIMEPLRFQALESNEVAISSPMEDFSYGMEKSHANIIGRRFMEPSYGKQSDEVATCQGVVIDGKCYIFNLKITDLP
ncbi:uncharacterized protein wu:fa56d06 isoform X2 [Ictalurus furcatus]|uniref:uncharacterized protein wu:fa56d06 isoform X2 n=1 Tax=Ictalurus furcatus TaxID=66913 RepID=UPI002350DEAB|nr:uncharacterized protein wu:fa56d06 isoform X2 [Ictalurus furcatus]